MDYALDVPMYFVYRNKKYIDCTGMSFRVSSCFCYLSACAVICSRALAIEYRTWLLTRLTGFIFVLQDFMVGKLPQAPGELPTLNDWENHLTTIFPEVCP